MAVTIYHNPRCTKSRQTLQILQDHGHDPDIVEYLKTPPGADRIKEILDMLGMSPRDLMRKKEAAYSEQKLDAPGLDDDALIEAMVRTPILIERPIVIKGGAAVIGRPPENVLVIL